MYTKNYKVEKHVTNLHEIRSIAVFFFLAEYEFGKNVLKTCKNSVDLLSPKFPYFELLPFLVVFDFKFRKGITVSSVGFIFGKEGRGNA